MDPAAYRSMNSFWNKVSLPPHIPEQSPDEKTEESAQSKPSDTDWTVYTQNVTRGNFNQNMDGDSRMHLGWTSPEDVRPSPAPTHQMSYNLWGGVCDQKDDEATPRPMDASASRYPHPSLALPHPSLNLDFRMSVTLNPRISVGPTPFGHRNWISFTGGSWSGSWGSGTVLPGGQDSQIIIPDGSARLETNYLLQTDDSPPAYIAIRTHGWRTGPPEILAQLADPKLADKVDPNSYKFRLFCEMETGDERYRDKINCGMWVGSGMRKGAEVIYDAYRLS